MELKRIFGASSKAQLMTMIMLIIFMLMLAELFAFALLNVTSNSVVQSFTLSSTSSNYGSLLKLSANNFAKESLNKAMLTLANYEYQPWRRKVNLITNTSFYLSSLVMNGNVPNDTSGGYPYNAMGNLTFLIYNKSIAGLLGYASQAVTVNESRPNVFQTDPYHIRMAYTERVLVNVSGDTYRYSIPVNVSIPLNNTPDLFYAQQGVLRTLKFANLTNITTVIGGNYAYLGNTLAYVYGTVYTLPSNSAGGAACSGWGSVDSRFNSPPLSTSLIIATYNALGFESCMNNYGGLITYTAPASTPTVPYLVYPSSSAVLRNLPNGTKVLLFGPGMDTLNIESLRSAIINNNYFASPFAPSYLSKGEGWLTKQSPNGIFSFAHYNRQALSLPGSSPGNVILLSKQIQEPTSAITVSAWVYSGQGSSATINSIVSTQGYGGYVLQEGNFIVFGAGGTPYNSPPLTIGTNSWHLLTGTFNSTTQKVGFYVDANLIGTASGPTAIVYSAPPNIVIGTQPSGGLPFNGLIANLQIYNQSLTPRQVQQLFQGGISGLPVSDNALVGWWPLNGNTHDYSGYNNNGTMPVNGNFVIPLNYTRDSVFGYQLPTQLSPLPGILCNSNSQCTDNTKPQLYLGYMPLETQGAATEVASFNGALPSNILIPSSPLFSPNALTIAGWIYFNTNSKWMLLDKYIGGTAGAFYIYGDYVSSGTGGSPEFSVFNSIGARFDTSFVPFIALNTHTWYFLTATFNGVSNVITTYVNATKEASTTEVGGLPPLSKNILFGAYAGGVGYYTNGLIANMQLYNASLSASAINSLYAAGISGLPLTSNLIGWWPLNGDSNDYMFGNNGVATNVVYPFFSGTYNSPGMSVLSTTSNEWQALGLGST